MAITEWLDNESLLVEFDLFSKSDHMWTKATGPARMATTFPTTAQHTEIDILRNPSGGIGKPESFRFAMSEELK